MSGGVVDRANAGFEDDRMSDDITTDQATYDALVRDAILWRKGKAMRPDDMIVWEAWGMVEQFAQSNPTCPEYFRGRVKEYQDRIAASRAAPEQLYPNLEQPDTWDAAPVPLPMVLHCPQCSRQHIDAPQPEKEWANPPHRSHECQFCGHVWRPADVATTGVQATQTHGSRDAVAWSYNAAPVPAREWIGRTCPNCGWSGDAPAQLTIPPPAADK